MSHSTDVTDPLAEAPVSAAVRRAIRGSTFVAQADARAPAEPRVGGNPPAITFDENGDFVGLNAQQAELVAFLDEVNGQDAYSNATAALGSLRRDEYLALPQGMVAPLVPANLVGDASVHGMFSKEFLAQVYALNKARAPPGEDATRYGLLRMEAVKLGWYAAQKEVAVVPAAPNAAEVLIADLAALRGHVVTARRAAFLIPMAAEHTFQTFGHHYLTGDAQTYETRYAKTFSACLAPEVATYARPTTLYHHALHWVSPHRVREVIESQIDGDRIPEAIKIRFNAAPAGSALVTTTAAVIRAIEASGRRKEIDDTKIFDLETIEAMDHKIRASTAKYHKVSHAYGLAPLTVAEQTEVDAAKVAAAKFAPVAQGFIEAFFREAALGRAKALQKHADENPIITRMMRNYFRDLAGTRGTTFATVLAQTAPAAAVATEGVAAGK